MRSVTAPERMADIPVGVRHRLRELTIGPRIDGMWSWTFRDGSTYACIAYEGISRKETAVQGWAACTTEDDILPVVGVYVSQEHRGRGTAGLLLRVLLSSLVGSGVLHKGDAVFAATWRWPAYPAIIEGCGLVCKPWSNKELTA